MIPRLLYAFALTAHLLETPELKSHSDFLKTEPLLATAIIPLPRGERVSDDGKPFQTDRHTSHAEYTKLQKWRQSCRGSSRVLQKKPEGFAFQSSGIGGVEFYCRSLARKISGFLGGLL
jgi:hypothetical protein